MSVARLRAPAAAGQRGAPDLILRMFEPPAIVVRNKDLAAILTPAYQDLAAEP